MKKIRTIILAVCMFVCSIFATGCLVQPQKMEKLKGTYKMVTYTMTFEEKTTNVMEAQGLEVYLVITGESKGYYAKKSNDVLAYVKEVDLVYEADEEDSDKIQKVNFKDSKEYKITWGNSLYVIKDEVYFKCPEVAKQEERHIRYEKVSDKTDLSYVKEKLGSDVPVYGYDEWISEADVNEKGNSQPQE